MLADQTAIVGIGATEFSKFSGRSQLKLALECSRAAIDDAGLKPADIDGFVTFTMDDTHSTALADALGTPEARYFSRTDYGGGGACAVVVQAAMAITSGLATNVLCYRAMNERSGVRFGAGHMGGGATAQVEGGWSWSSGLTTPASRVAMIARRYMHEYGATSEDFGEIAVASRLHASTNPNAWFYNRPITLKDHQESRWVTEPLHLLDCCQESDGGVAIVVTSLDRARHLPNPPAVVRAAAQGHAIRQGYPTASGYYRDRITELPEGELTARQLWSQSGLQPSDIQTAVFYDHFSPLVLMQIEAYGFCGTGEGKDFIADGNVRIGGRLPINTHGGQLGEAYIHGVNGVAEGVRQVRGTAVNQVPSVEHVLVTAGSGVPTSAVVLGVDRT